MKTQLLKKLSAFIMIILMFSFADAQRSSKSFMNLLNKKNDVRIKGTPYLPFKNKSLPDKHDSSILWQQTIGGSGHEDRGAIRTIRGGYITCGSTNSPDNDFQVPANHDFDAYVVKLNNEGNLVWAHTYGGSGYDDFNDIIPTSDGGFIAIGSSMSNDGDLTGNHGDKDVWVVKLDANGKIQWQQNYGGHKDDHGNFIVQSNDGYAFCAGAASANGDLKILFPHGHLDAWIVKISLSGKILFQQIYGGSDDEDTNGIYFNDKEKTIVFGSYTLSNNGDVTGNHGERDAWVVKIDEAGNIIWKKTLGGSGDDVLNGLARTIDGNIVFATFSNSVDGDVAGNNGLYVAWLVKLNVVTGNIIWNKTFANPAELGALAVLATADGGSVAMGLFGSSADSQTWDAMLLKLDASGNQQWIKIFGGSKQDFAEFGDETPNGDIITSNYTESNDGDVKNAIGGADTWIVKFGNSSNNFSGPAIVNPPISNDRIGEISLSNYPNPFTNSTTISFTISQSQKISLKIYDMNGVLVKILADEPFEKGQHQLQWNTTEAKAGIYILEFDAKDYNETKKLYVIK
ncbi:T9SS type A sorting domain-containing protein [Flavobacterium sp. ZS1P14]|uniref:T9SS type A sorting domain-containing protein n=1 Tax=Flavobacterium sp. ZS1P14 TaxID=3401729 RepID=UPI003AAA3C0C